MAGRLDAWRWRAERGPVFPWGLGGSGVGGPSAAADPGDRGRSAGVVADARRAPCAAGPAFDRARQAAARLAAASLLSGPPRAAADGLPRTVAAGRVSRRRGATAICCSSPPWSPRPVDGVAVDPAKMDQPPAAADGSSACRWMRRSGTPRPSASMPSGWTRGNRDRLLDGDVARHFLVAVPRQPRVEALLSTEPFFGGWDADRSLGQRQELRAEGWSRPSSGSRPPWPAPGPNGGRTGFLAGSSAPTTPARRRPTPMPGWRARGRGTKRSLAWDMGSWRTATARWSTRRPPMRPARPRAGRRGRVPGDEGRAARRPRHPRPALGHRWPDQAPLRPWKQPGRPQADRRSVRLGQDDRRPGPDPRSRPAARRLRLHADRCGPTNLVRLPELPAPARAQRLPPQPEPSRPACQTPSLAKGLAQRRQRGISSADW